VKHKNPETHGYERDRSVRSEKTKKERKLKKNEKTVIHNSLHC